MFCLQYAIWVDSGKRSKQISQRTKDCSCNILPPEKQQQLDLASEALFLLSTSIFLAWELGWKTHWACGQRTPVLV